MSKRVFIFLSACILLLPMAMDVLRVDLGSSENRGLEERPKYRSDRVEQSGQRLGVYWGELMAYKDSYSSFYKDNFVLKKLLFKPYAWFKSSVLLTDPVPQKVMKANHGWYFLGNSYSEVVRESLGLSLFSEKQLSSIEARISRLKDELAKNGIAYYLTVAPNKHTIYGEQLLSAKYDGPTKLKQVELKLEASGIDLIDLAKGYDKHDEQLFHKTNTHWNDLGAYLGHVTLIERIADDFIGIRPLPMERLSIVDTLSTQEDLTKMLDVHINEPKKLFKVIEPRAQLISSKLEVPSDFTRKPETYEYRTSSGVNELKVIVFRDSFSTALMKYLSELFGEVVYVWTYDVDLKLIEQESPDIVIQEVVERELDSLVN